jgi:hypothetical protein
MDVDEAVVGLQPLGLAPPQLDPRRAQDLEDGVSWVSVIGSSTTSPKKNGMIEQQPPGWGIRHWRWRDIIG